MEGTKDTNENRLKDGLASLSVLHFRHNAFKPVSLVHSLEETGYVMTDFGRHLHFSHHTQLLKHQTYNKESALGWPRVQTQLSNKRNVVLYLDKDLIENTRELGFNLSKTFENTLKHLINTYSNVNHLNNNENSNIQGCWWAGPDLNRRPLARKANVLTKLDDRPTSF